MSSLVKTKTTLHLLVWKDPTYYGFSEDGVDSSVKTLTLERGIWVELGCPSTITVSVEPGDTLNGGAT